MAMNKKNLKKMFPNLYRELEGGENRVPIDGVREDATVAEEERDVEVCECEEAHQYEKECAQRTKIPDKLRHFNPQAVDFLRRCDTADQAEEIIAYLQKKGEVSEEYAKELRSQLKKSGVRSFGPKKEENYYFHEGGIY
ncbi:DUF2095 family protein [Candidatus Bathycorpusculum sp.]|uniref:DUF2095 family protein n=1 Tax=Candidatus Bathycorpusculum sp. TaxID=2994959 RepID=UPI0028364545|nr:DUF2095 domain-containing protein [Candidatus Termitimicrobium sp.]MCL2432023.1 DUF2095 domain-containing protein [Candidatus Termitimicrobium sp.]